MNTPQPLTPNIWFVLGSSLTSAMVEIIGPGGQVYIGGSAPAVTDSGFTIPGNLPVDVPNVAANGGTVAVRTQHSDCTVRYAVV